MSDSLLYKDNRLHAEYHQENTIEDKTRKGNVGHNVFAWYNFYVECYNDVNEEKLSYIPCLSTIANCFVFLLFLGACGGPGTDIFCLLFYGALAFVPYFNIRFLLEPELQHYIIIENWVMLGICSFCMLCLLIGMIIFLKNQCKSRCAPFRMMIYAPEICFGMQNRFYKVTSNNFLDVIGVHTAVTRDKIMGAIAMYRADVSSNSFIFMVYNSSWSIRYYKIIISFFVWLIISVITVINFTYARQEIIIVVE
jgi:hypothetical protein